MGFFVCILYSALRTAAWKTIRTARRRRVAHACSLDWLVDSGASDVVDGQDLRNTTYTVN